MLYNLGLQLSNFPPHKQTILHANLGMEKICQAGTISFYQI